MIILELESWSILVWSLALVMSLVSCYFLFKMQLLGVNELYESYINSISQMKKQWFQI